MHHLLSNNLTQPIECTFIGALNIGGSVGINLLWILTYLTDCCPLGGHLIYHLRPTNFIESLIELLNKLHCKISEFILVL